MKLSASSKKSRIDDIQAAERIHSESGGKWVEMWWRNVLLVGILDLLSGQI
jgi:hypothetical protein